MRVVRSGKSEHPVSRMTSSFSSTVRRRTFLGRAVWALSAGLLWSSRLARAAGAAVAPAKTPSRRYRIGVCDWMILKRQKLGAFQLAKDIGVDGLEVDMGGLGDRETFDNQLRDPAVRERFRAASR